MILGHFGDMLLDQMLNGSGPFVDLKGLIRLLGAL